jgi:hypothetical protein
MIKLKYIYLYEPFKKLMIQHNELNDIELLFEQTFYPNEYYIHETDNYNWNELLNKYGYQFEKNIVTNERRLV